MGVVPPRFSNGNQVIVILPHNRFQLLLFVAHAACIGVDALQLAIDPATFLRGEALIPTSQLSGASVVSNINNPYMFAAGWLSIPYLH